MGGSSNSAAREANAAEANRQASIRSTQANINRVFDNPQRKADIADFVNATRDYYQQDLNRQKANADRNLTFSLAKSGLVGGSTQVDQQRLLGENYSRGLLQAEQKAQGAGASLEAADQDARARLNSLATSGLDATTAASQSAAAMRSNLQAGKSDALMGSLGDSFGPISDFVDRSRKRRSFGGATWTPCRAASVPRCMAAHLVLASAMAVLVVLALAMDNDPDGCRSSRHPLPKEPRQVVAGG